MSSATFHLIYDGEEIGTGEMDVLVLGPALQAMGELFQAADSALNGSETTTKTSVKAEFREGSFEILERNKGDSCSD